MPRPIGRRRSAGTIKRTTARIRYFRNDRNIGAALNFNRALSWRAHRSSMAAPATISTTRGSWSAASTRSTAIRVWSSATRRTRLIGEQGEPLPFDRERNCYIDSYGGDRDLGDVMRPQPPHIGDGGQPRAALPGRALADGLVLAALRGDPPGRRCARPSLYANYSGADKVLLAELALQGRFHEIGDELFSKRMHRDCTHYKTTRERAQLRIHGAAGIPQVRMLRDYTRMTFAADLSTAQRLHCMVTIVGMARRCQVWRRLLVPGPDNFLGLSFDGR